MEKEEKLEDLRKKYSKLRQDKKEEQEKQQLKNKIFILKNENKWWFPIFWWIKNL